MGLQFMMVGLPAIMMAVSGFVYQRYYRLHEGFNQEEEKEIEAQSEHVAASA
ncbi:Melibiose carrier protein, Na+/melibiose symporter [Vibrio aestuarianus]|nr:Melibiose carrier protein, Na+/melibiose symporter [Vibrio aestuarianus]